MSDGLEMKAKRELDKYVADISRFRPMGVRNVTLLKEMSDADTR